MLQPSGTTGGETPDATDDLPDTTASRGSADIAATATLDQTVQSYGPDETENGTVLMGN